MSSVNNLEVDQHTWFEKHVYGRIDKDQNELSDAQLKERSKKFNKVSKIVGGGGLVLATVGEFGWIGSYIHKSSTEFSLATGILAVGVIGFCVGLAFDNHAANIDAYLGSSPDRDSNPDDQATQATSIEQLSIQAHKSPIHNFVLPVEDRVLYEEYRARQVLSQSQDV